MVFILIYRNEIGFSSLSISSTTEVTLDLKVMKASTNCFFVVVGGKYLRLMDKVMDIVDNVTEDVGRRPLAVFYVTKDEKITSFYDQPFHLPLVINSIFIILHIYIKQLYFMLAFCNFEKFVQLHIHITYYIYINSIQNLQKGWSLAHIKNRY